MSEDSANKEIVLLRNEIKRLNKIVDVLISRAEQATNAHLSDFGVFQATVMLEDQVRSRTQELEEAFHRNEKITHALQQANVKIEQEEKRLRDVISALGKGLLVLTADGKINFANKAACEMLGWRENEIINKDAHLIFYDRDASDILCIEDCPHRIVTTTGKLYRSEDRYFGRQDGTRFPVDLVATPIVFEDNTTGVVIVFHDTTIAKQERDWLLLLQAAIERSPISVIITDQQANIIYTNPQVTQTTGYGAEELHGRCMSIFQSGQTSAKAYDEMWETILSGKVWRGESLDRRKNGTLFWESLSIAPVADEHGEVKYFISVSEDITEKKKIQSLLQEMSFRDSLTGVANRRRFDEYYTLEWQQAKRTAMPLAVIMIDVDFFKRYNDRFGHQLGDECLIQIAKALQSKIMRSGDLLARYGGEEFVCLLPGTDVVGAELVANSMREAVLAQKIPHPDSSVSPYVTISLGVACTSNRMNDDSIKLLHDADEALYRAKSLGSNRVEVATRLID